MFGQRRTRLWRFLAMLAVLGLLAAACGDDDDDDETGAGDGTSATTGGGGGGGDCDTPGITADEIKLGVLYPASGSVGTTFLPFLTGIEARVGVQNEENDGVNGRQITLEVADDGNELPRNLAGARELVEGNDVFAIIASSPAQPGGADYLEEEGIPVTGWAFNTPWEEKPNFIGYLNVLGGPNSSGGTSDVWGKFFESKGATKVAGAAFDNPESSRAGRAVQASARQVGLELGPYVGNIPFGSTDFTSFAQQVNSSGSDALQLPMTVEPNLAALGAVKQAGVDLKSALLFTGYDQRVLQAAAQVLEGASFTSNLAPFELELPIHKTFADALKEYGDSDTVDSISASGWVSTDLMIEGLKAAGDCPTRQGLIDAIRGLEGYDADGFLPEGIDYSAEGQGEPLECLWFVTVEGGKFVPDNNGEALCGDEILEIPDQL